MLYSSSTLVLLLFVLTIAGLIRYQQSSHKVFGALFLILYLSDLVSTEQVISSFSNQGLLTLMLIMTCSLAIEKTRLLRAITSYMIERDYRLTSIKLFGLTALASSTLNNTAVVSTMLAPIRNNPHHASSKLLIPLSYAAILGGTLTLVGTSTNLIVNSMVIEAGLPSLGFFDFTPVGVVVVVLGGLLMLLISRWLPERHRSKEAIADYFIDTKVGEGSSLIGKSVEQNGLRHLEDLFLVEIMRKGRLISPVTPAQVIEAEDRLLFSGDVKKVTLLNQFDGLSIFASQNGLPLDNLKEVVLKPDSRLVGKTLKSAGFRALFDSAVVAMRRDGAPMSGKLGEVVLKPGDYLALATGPDFAARRNISKNFYMLTDLATEQTLEGLKEKLAVGGFFVAIGLSALGILPLFKGMLLLLSALLATGALTANEVFHRMPRNIWLIIASALMLSQALGNTGALDVIDQMVQSNQSVFTPWVGLVFIYLLAWVMTELVTNNAAAALVFPIAIELAQSLAVEPKIYILALAFGASASFISPYGYQTNLMVFNAGHYRIQDFARVGIPMCVLYGLIVIATLPVFVGF
ncbi:SLC13 family permease [Vibrio sp. WXL103]|uniref:SLC13 family permease n=1 Tax=Vibrio sp. WXL103 TaxID=3450710 RepID=UPI003EC86366